MTGRLLGKRVLLPAALLATGVVLAASTQPWAQGSPRDELLGRLLVRGTGAALAPLAPAGSLVAGAAVLAVATAGRVVRVAATVLAPLAATAVLLAVAGVATDPGRALAPVAARTAGRSGAVLTDATTTGWVWVALGAAGLLCAATLGVAVGGRTWRGLSSRYDAPVTSAPEAPPRHTDAWDRLSHGEDPTEETGPDQAGRPGPSAARPRAADAADGAR